VGALARGFRCARSDSAGSWGVYLVFRADETAPVFLERSAGGQHKRNDPSVSRDVLEANWVDAFVVYIGKGNHGQLRTRLKEYAKAGAGKNHGHHGGRLIWQLAGGQDLLIAWRILPAELAPLREEKRMICEFRESYGKPPFANDPHRQGR